MPKARLHLLNKADHIDTVVREYKAGRTTVQIAADHHLNPKVVRSWLREEGVPIRKGARKQGVALWSCVVCGRQGVRRSWEKTETCSLECQKVILSERKTGVSRPDLQTEEWRKACSENTRRGWEEGVYDNRPGPSPERVRQMREEMLQRWRNGEDFNQARGRKVYAYAGIKMRSTWETTAASYFDAKGWQWQYEPRRFVLGSGVSYLPDFYLPEFDVWVEVKGWLTDPAAAKFAEFVESGRRAYMVKGDSLEQLRAELELLESEVRHV